MNINKPILLLALAALTALPACVPNKKIAYLQHGNEYDNPSSVLRDSLVRKYETGNYSYRLHTGDMLDIKISTMTPTVYNPFIDADRNLVPGQQMTQSYDPARIIQPQGYLVEDDGYLNIPLIGRIKVEDYTLSQAEDTIEVHVRKILEKPVVRLKILNYRFTVLGEVKAESTYITGDNSLNLLEAIGLAGGASEFGDLSRVKIIRDYREGTGVFYVNLLSEDFLSSPYYYVQPGDVIVVTPLKQRAYLKYAGPNLSIVAGSVSLLIAVISLLR